MTLFVITSLAMRLPVIGYRLRLVRELRVYRDREEVNDLPAIFHYWSNRFVRPMLEEVGVSHPDHFFARFLADSAKTCGQGEPVFVSIGAGNCDTEVRVAKLLRQAGLGRFTMQCLDINPAMLERGMALAHSEGVDGHLQPLIGDFNDWCPDRGYAGVMANQSLHHVVELEHLFDAVRKALQPKASFVINDIVGRNGHMRWPNALAAVQQFWQELPSDYRYNRALRRSEPVYQNWDCSREGFEGIRAQDIVPLLLERFHFHVFIGFGNVVDVFVDRNFGYSFDPETQWDRDFVNRLHAFDEASFASGKLTPTHMLAVVATQPSDQPFYSRGIDPRELLQPVSKDLLR